MPASVPLAVLQCRGAISLWLPLSATEASAILPFAFS